MEWSTRTFGSQGPAGTYQRPGRHSRSSSTSSTSSSRSPPRSPSSSPPSPPARRRRSRPKASDYFGLAPGATLEDPIDSLSGVLADLDPKRERPSSDDDEAASDPANRIPVSTGFSDASERGCEDSEESRETPVPYTSYRDYSADDADADDEEERAPKKKKKRARRTRTRKASKEEGSSSSGYAVESSQTTKKSYSPPSSPTPPSTPATPSSLSSSYYSTPGTDCSSRSSSPDSPPTPYTPVSQLGVGARGLFDDGLDDVMEDASQATGFQNKGGFSGQLFTGGSTPNFGAPKFSNPTNTSWTQHGGQNSGAVNFNRPSVANMGQGGFAQGTAPFNSFAPPQTYNHPPFFDSASQFTAPPPPHQQQRQQQQRPQSFGSFAPSPPHPPASNNTSMPTTSTGTSPFGRPTNSVFPAPPPNVAANFSASNPFNKTNQPQSNPFAGKPPQPTAQPQPQVNPFAGPSLVASQPAFAAAAPFPAAATPFPAVATPFPGTSSPFTGPASPFTGAGSRFNGAAPSGPASGSSFKPPAATEKKPVFPQAPAQNGSAPNPFFNGVKASNQPPSPPPSDTEEVVETRKVRFTDSDAVADRYNRVCFLVFILTG